MAKQIKEATETIVKVVRISGKTKPLAINGKENTDNVVFLRAFDAESGARLDTPLSITESRAKMFGFHASVLVRKQPNEIMPGIW